MASDPRPASTILLCRDAAEGLETFMVVRHHQIDFASGALVFPGGKVDEGDSHPGVLERCEGESDAAMIPFEVAAIRETFEECGVFLAREAGGSELISGDRLRGLEHYRDPLNTGAVSLIDVLEKEDLTLACDMLERFAHWVTPTMMPKRFDTHFFVAKAPADHLAIHDGTESVDSVWINPSRLLQEAQDGKWQVIFPTRCNVQMLEPSRSVDDVLSSARDREIVCVTPWVEQRDDAPYLCIPPEAGYPISEERADRMAGA